MQTKQEVVDEASEKINNSPAFKGYHGFVRLNIADGRVKTEEISQTLLKTAKN